MGVAHLQGGSLTGVSEEERKAQLTQALLFFKVRADRDRAAEGSGQGLSAGAEGGGRDRTESRTQSRGAETVRERRGRAGGVDARRGRTTLPRAAEAPAGLAAAACAPATSLPPHPSSIVHPTPTSTPSPPSPYPSPPLSPSLPFPLRRAPRRASPL